MSDTQPEAYAGSFVNKETGAIITIEHLAGFNFSLTLSDQNRYDANLLKPDLMLAGPYRLTFPDEPSDHDSRVLLDGDRIIQVEFERVTGREN